MATFNNRRTLVTKARLRESLISIMETKPIEKVSVTELCRKAGINRSTFYLHYESPQKLLEGIEQAIMDEVGLFMASFHMDGDKERRISEFLRRIRSEERTLRILFSSDCTMFLLTLHSLIMKHLPNLIPPGGTKNDQMRLVFASSGQIGVILDWFKNGFQPSEEIVAHFIYKNSMKTMGDSVLDNPYLTSPA